VCVVGLGAAHGFALLLLEPGVADSLLAAALGDRRARGPEEQGEGRSEFTGVEQLVLKRLLTILTDAMRRAWEDVLPFQPEVLRLEVDPRMTNIAPPGDVGIVATFELSGGIEGRLQLVIPYAAVEPAKGKLAAPRQLAQRGDGRIQKLLVREVEQVEVDVRGLLGCATIPFSRLLELQPGNLLLLDSDEGSPVPIFVQGRRKMLGRPSVFGGAMALVVETTLKDLPPPLPAGPPPALPRSESR
jgi:flagellar motor switch protein FliM